MAILNNFVFYANWREFIKSLSNEEDKYQLLNAIMEYGITGEYDDTKLSPMVKNVFETMIRGAIDKSQKNYRDSIDYGKTHGRPKTVDDYEIVQLFKSGMKAKEIAKQLGISEAAVYHSDGWKNRKTWE